jgi:hypothetical protein|nr:MAG TPA: hypothetical protein [Caudoviricetes sp.]
MARKLKIKKLDKKDVKKEIQTNTDVHLFLFSVYRASGHLIKKFKLFNQLGLNEHSLLPNSDLDINKVKIKSMDNYPMLSNFEGLKSLIEQITRASFLFHSDEMKAKYNFDKKIYREKILGRLYNAKREIKNIKYIEKWKEDLPCADKEVADALETLKDVVVNFKVVEEFANMDLDIDVKLKKYIRTLMTKFNKYFLTYVTEIIESGS